MKALLTFIRDHGPLKHAYPVLRRTLVVRLEAEPEPHSLLLDAVGALLSSGATASSAPDAAPWPGGAFNAYCSLLLEAAPQLSIGVGELDLARAKMLALEHPHLFRKLADAYHSPAMSEAALLTVQTLLERGDPAEAALLAVGHGLLAHLDDRALIKAVAAANKQHAVDTLLNA